MEQVWGAAAVGHEGHLLQQRHLRGHRQPQDGRGLRGGAQHRPHAGVCAPGRYQVAQAAALHRLRRLPLRLRQGLQCALHACTMSHDTFTHMRKGLPVRLAVISSACSPPPAQMKSLLPKDLLTMSGAATFSSYCQSASYGQYLMRLRRRRSCTRVSLGSMTLCSLLNSRVVCRRRVCEGVPGCHGA